MERLLRFLSIRRRIIAIAALNTGVVFLLTLVVLDGANPLQSAWSELLQVQQRDRVLSSVVTDSVRLQSLIHRYFTQPDADLLVQIEATRTSLSNATVVGAKQGAIADSATEMASYAERLITAFERLRSVRLRISGVYEGGVLNQAREISGLYAIVESTLRGSSSLIVPVFSKSRDVFSNVLVATNGYYLTFSANWAQEAFSGLETIEQTVPVMLDLAETQLQRASLEALKSRISGLRENLLRLSAAFDEQSSLLRDDVDQSQRQMSIAASQLSSEIQARELDVQGRLDRILNRVYLQIAGVGIAAFVLIALIGTALARSVNGPLDNLIRSMERIVGGRLEEPIQGTAASDELGKMARAIEVFRRNAIAKKAAEDEVRASRDRIETAYGELRAAQSSLVEAEKLAALGGLVAGVAHEVNNPVGISITVASTLARRTAVFAREVETGPLRRSSLNEFLHSSRDAADQLVANLARAGDLIQSFKQVAADRSHAERRTFDLRETVEQIVASLRPSLSKRPISLTVSGIPSLEMDSYPGLIGQVLTNLFLNAIIHAFAERESGEIEIRIKEQDADRVLIEFADNGHGMTDATRNRIFEPFFTTVRGKGGTGLGLHIAYNVVTSQLGGQITVRSTPEIGSVFCMIMPRKAPSKMITSATTLEKA
jgi:signal transduction histidine kinase